MKNGHISTLFEKKKVKCIWNTFISCQVYYKYIFLFMYLIKYPAIALELAVCCEFFFTWRGSSNHLPVVLCECPGLFTFLRSPVRLFFLWMYQTVDLAAPNSLSRSLSLSLSLKPNNSVLLAWCGFRAPASKYKWHTWNQPQTFYLLNWCRKKWRNNPQLSISFWVNCPITYEPLKKRCA